MTCISRCSIAYKLPVETGALRAASIRHLVYKTWHDDGIMTERARKKPVLHPATMSPAERKMTPARRLSTWMPHWKELGYVINPAKGIFDNFETLTSNDKPITKNVLDYLVND